MNSVIGVSGDQYNIRAVSGEDYNSSMFLSWRCVYSSLCHVCRVVAWWRTKYPENVIKGYKMNLQHALGTRIPNGILNFFFKYTFARKVSSSGKGSHHDLLLDSENSSCCTEDVERGHISLKLLCFLHLHTSLYVPPVSRHCVYTNVDSDNLH
jgi:hypothetical protein